MAPPGYGINVEELTELVEQSKLAKIMYSRKRKSAWEWVGQQYLERCGTEVPVKTLQRKWGNISAKSRKAQSMAKASSKMTGGGVGDAPLDEMTARVLVAGQTNFEKNPRGLDSMSAMEAAASLSLSHHPAELAAEHLPAGCSGERCGITYRHGVIPTAVGTAEPVVVSATADSHSFGGIAPGSPVSPPRYLPSPPPPMTRPSRTSSPSLLSLPSPHGQFSPHPLPPNRGRGNRQGQSVLLGTCLQERSGIEMRMLNSDNTISHIKREATEKKEELNIIRLQMAKEEQKMKREILAAQIKAAKYIEEKAKLDAETAQLQKHTAEAKLEKWGYERDLAKAKYTTTTTAEISEQSQNLS